MVFIGFIPSPQFVTPAVKPALLPLIKPLAPILGPIIPLLEPLLFPQPLAKDPPLGGLPFYNPADQEKKPRVPPPFEGGQCNKGYSIYGQINTSYPPGSALTPDNFNINGGYPVQGPITAMTLDPFGAMTAQGFRGGIIAPSWKAAYMVSYKTIIFDTAGGDNCGSLPDIQESQKIAPQVKPTNKKLINNDLNPVQVPVQTPEPEPETQPQPQPTELDIAPPILDKPLPLVPPFPLITPFPALDTPSPPLKDKIPPIDKSPIIDKIPTGNNPTKNPVPSPDLTKTPIKNTPPPTPCEEMKECLSDQLPPKKIPILWAIRVTDYPPGCSQVYTKSGKKYFTSAGYVHKLKLGLPTFPRFKVTDELQYLECAIDEIPEVLPAKGYTITALPI